MFSLAPLVSSATCPTFFTTPAWPLGLAAALLSASLVGAYALRKLYRIHLLLYTVHDDGRRDAVALFRQVEALHGLYAELNLNNNLPATRDWAASPDFLMVLLSHARAERPRVVVECSSGVSTLVLARAMQLNGAGKVYSLEHDPRFGAATRAQLVRLGLSDWAEVLDAPLREQQHNNESWCWYAPDALSALPHNAPIGMLVIDGPPQSTGKLARYPAGPALFGRLGAEACVLIDDASRPDEQAMLARWAREFPDLRQLALPCEKGCALLRRDVDPDRDPAGT
jgi:hypothetical protein